ncbi:molybdopterin synthase sulfur carrier subunit [Kocuria tytonicola]|uniref:MoaD/ThiS family protein n=1 Tax=Kocuria tytonicola TaxID=2055946 RepID=A0A3L9LBC0_9MICC|nr:MoaD/ThiS family protein [Kocuria tytonicola]RLY94387.1 MoaD/ThiS family protein [Kocuria tytonicola]RLZ03639.1 molybdopterin synthase sulfur carrier subunit [Kocuria tytonicola]
MLVRYFAAAAAAAGTDEEHVSTSTVLNRTDLEQLLVTLHPVAPEGERTLAQVLPRCSLLVDGITARDPATPLAPGATVDVLPPFAGG